MKMAHEGERYVPLFSPSLLNVVVTEGGCRKRQ
jgi:hypothetical protein